MSNNGTATGRPRRKLRKLVEELAGPVAGAVESRLQDRLRAEGAGPGHELAFTDHMIALVIMRFQRPRAALAVLAGAGNMLKLGAEKHGRPAAEPTERRRRRARHRPGHHPRVGRLPVKHRHLPHRQLERMGDEATVGFACFSSRPGGKAISVTFGRRKKEQRNLYMTPQQARTMAEVIRRKVRPVGEIAKILRQEGRP